MEKENLENKCEFAGECKNCKAEGDYRLCSRYRVKQDEKREIKPREVFVYGAGI